MGWIMLVTYNQAQVCSSPTLTDVIKKVVKIRGWRGGSAMKNIGYS